jgi:uncharacterized protein YecE (DUF72 family)
MKWHIGCSGFMYRDWKGIFYPEGIRQKDWLQYYSTQFDTLEINNTFYKFPEAKNLEKFYDQTSDGFQFSLKAPRVITHFKKLKDCDSEFKDLYEATSKGLKEKLGPILFQFPPSFSFNEESLQVLKTKLDRDFKNIVEFRNASWFNNEVAESLAESSIIMSGLSHPILKNNQQVIENNNTIYYRFHGLEKLFYSAYNEDNLKSFYKEVVETKAEEIFVYFNNTASQAAIQNALYLKELATNSK